MPTNRAPCPARPLVQVVAVLRPLYAGERPCVLQFQGRRHRLRRGAFAGPGARPVADRRRAGRDAEANAAGALGAQPDVGVDHRGDVHLLVTEEGPLICHWLPTREAAAVRSVRKAISKFPKSLAVRASVAMNNGKLRGSSAKRNGGTMSRTSWPA
jgi:hypothetical protein